MLTMQEAKIIISPVIIPAENYPDSPEKTKKNSVYLPFVNQRKKLMKIRIILILALLITMISAHSQDAGVSRTGCTSGDCKNGKGTYVYSTGDVYTGDFLNGKRHGDGKYIAQNGDLYEGEFYNGMFEGYGIYYFKSGKVYEGYWESNKFHGFGQLFAESGELEKQGDWENGVLVFAGTEEEVEQLREESDELLVEAFKAAFADSNGSHSGQGPQFTFTAGSCENLNRYGSGIASSFNGLYKTEEAREVVGMIKYPVKYPLFGISDGFLHDWNNQQWISFSSESGDLESQFKSLVQHIDDCLGNEWVKTVQYGVSQQTLSMAKFINGHSVIGVTLSDYRYKKVLELAFRKSE
jgi:hypothetical protein